MRDTFTTESPNIPLRYVALRRMSVIRFMQTALCGVSHKIPGVAHRHR